MRALHFRRGIYALLSLAGGFVIGLAALGYAPVVAAGCPSCFGFESATPARALYLDPDAAIDAPTLAARYETAVARVEDVFGDLPRHPVVLACGTARCNRVMGNYAARAMTFGHHLFYLGPHGHDTEIVAHELAHVALHQRLGLRGQGGFPAWVDEGLAVYVSRDPRFNLNPETCTPPDGAMPIRAHQWRVEANDAQVSLYGLAGCAVAQWFAANPGASVDDLIAAHVPQADGGPTGVATPSATVALTK